MSTRENYETITRMLQKTFLGKKGGNILSLFIACLVYKARALCFELDVFFHFEFCYPAFRFTYYFKAKNLLNFIIIFFCIL